MPNGLDCPSMCIRMCSGIRLHHTFCNRPATCVPYRKCWDILPSPRHRFTLLWISSIWPKFTILPIRELKSKNPEIERSSFFPASRLLFFCGKCLIDQAISHNRFGSRQATGRWNIPLHKKTDNSCRPFFMAEKPDPIRTCDSGQSGRW